MLSMWSGGSRKCSVRIHSKLTQHSTERLVKSPVQSVTLVLTQAQQLVGKFHGSGNLTAYTLKIPKPGG